MKRSFAPLIAVALLAIVVMVGCTDSATVTQPPDTAPPLAPVLLGARGNEGTVGVWWQSNTEPDLAGYYVYATIGGITTRVTRTPIHNTYLSWQPQCNSPVTLHVTAIDWTGNESNPSQSKMVSPTRDSSGGVMDNLLDKELNAPR
jgi:hypothetical protein